MDSETEQAQIPQEPDSQNEGAEKPEKRQYGTSGETLVNAEAF